MPYSPVSVERFGGLNLRDDPQDVGFNGAVDLLNIDPSDGTRCQPRDGTTLFATVPSTTVMGLYPSYRGLFVIREANVDAVNTSGVVSTLAVGLVRSIAEIGTPTATYSFFATGGAALRRYDGTSLVASVGSPKYVAATPWDNRLVQGHFTSAAASPTGANGSTSTVFFSGAGTPETYAANDYLHLEPGDGEEITGIVNWNDLLFVFKRSKMFVFYGTSTSAAGTPVFNYRTVRLPSEVWPMNTAVTPVAYQPLTRGPDGVYFACRNGIYRTTGSAPVLMSQAISPVFDGSSPDLSIAGFEYLVMGWAGDNLALAYTNAANSSMMMVWNQVTAQWSRWSMSGTSWSPPPVEPRGSGLVGVYAAVVGKVLKFSPTATADDGVAISSYYQSGFADLGSPLAKSVRELELWGSGSPTVSVFTDHGSADANAAAVALGVSPAVDNRKHRRSYRGSNFSVKLSATGAWSVNRVNLMVRESRAAGVGS